MARITRLAILFVLFALSLLLLQNLPQTITDSSEWSTIIYVLWFLSFSTAFIKVAVSED